MINTEWIKATSAEYHVFPARSDVSDGAGHALVTAYALRGSQDDWSVMIVNRDQFNLHKVQVAFHEDGTHAPNSFAGPVAVSIFGREQYEWHPASTFFMAHASHSAEDEVLTNTKGHADPDGPVLHSSVNGSSGTLYEIPAASIVVLRGKLGK
jgi:hypothetical protein